METDVAASSGPSEEKFSIIIKWQKEEIRIERDANSDASVLDMKQEIYEKTGVRPERQKLLGLKYNGQPADDCILLDDLEVKPNTKIMMMGTKEEDVKKFEEQAAQKPDTVVINDFDEIGGTVTPLHKRPEIIAKIDLRVKKYPINVINAPRPGKKLLVLDIDYTLFDHKSPASNFSQLMRPHLHQFLASAYEDFDIAIWSATSRKWVEIKIRELGLANHPDFKLVFYMDIYATVSFKMPEYVTAKPLAVIWGKFPQYNSNNTIMFDDIARNFYLNPQNGLVIKPFRKAHKYRHSDNELFHLARYLKIIAKMDDLSTLDHKYWKSLVALNYGDESLRRSSK